MTKSETATVMMLLRTAFPRYYVNQSQQEMEDAIDLWHEMLKQFDARLVASAIKALIATVKFPPTIAEVIEKINMLSNPPEMSEMEAWGYVSKALRNGYYGAVEEFNKLPIVIQRLVGSPNQLKEWAIMDIDEVQTVIQSNFMRSYKARAKYEREFLAMPSEVQALLTDISGAMSMDKQLEGPKAEKTPSVT